MKQTDLIVEIIKKYTYQGIISIGSTIIHPYELYKADDGTCSFRILLSTHDKRKLNSVIKRIEAIPEVQYVMITKMSENCGGYMQIYMKKEECK